jgi:hypothetical protein
MDAIAAGPEPQQALFAATIEALYAEADADRVAFLTELARRVFAPEAAA